MQKFFTTTIITKFIKYLLMSTPIPRCSFINDHDVMVSGSLYVYRGKIYKCTQTGIFKGSDRTVRDNLYCSETVYCSDNLYVTDRTIDYGGKRLAKFDIIGLYMEGQDKFGLTEDYISTKGYYDSETHRRLGDYVRLLKSMYNLDLMSLYNCFNNFYVDNVDISSGKLLDVTNPRYKVTLVPIKFNRTYTIAMNSSSDVYMKPVIYNGKLIQDENGDYVYDNSYTDITKLGQLSYNRPVQLSIWNTDEKAQLLEGHLYLAIQLPINISTPITVLEGKYFNYNRKNIYDNKLFTYSIDSALDSVFTSKSSLLNSMNTFLAGSTSTPFSDRLIEYLVQHTIDCREVMTENVDRVSTAFGYSSGFSGSWSRELRGKLFEAYMKMKSVRDELSYEDILGYVDKDIEDALNKGYLRYGRVK